MGPIALACCLWKERFCSLKINFNSDNMAVVQILNSKSSKSDRVTTLVRFIVQWSMECSFHIKAVHLSGVNNEICDSISRMQWETFRRLAPEADSQPTPIPDSREVFDVFRDQINVLVSNSLSENTK